MRLLIAAVGKLKDAEERAICERYQKRANGTGKPLGLAPLDIQEFPESRAASVSTRKEDEAERLMRAAGADAVTIALDVTGSAFSSEAFATLLKRERDGGAKSCAFLIGGPDGHGPSVLSTARHTLTLGPLTLPHGLARVVLAEQIYRALTILSGHPYHRA